MEVLVCPRSVDEILSACTGHEQCRQSDIYRHNDHYINNLRPLLSLVHNVNVRVLCQAMDFHYNPSQSPLLHEQI